MTSFEQVRQRLIQLDGYLAKAINEAANQKAKQAAEHARSSLHDALEWLLTAQKRETENELPKP